MLRHRRPAMLLSLAARGAFALCLGGLCLGGPCLAGTVIGGCGGAQGRVRGAETVTSPTRQVSDDAFAAAVHDALLSAPKSSERNVRLEGVVARQLARSAARFASKEAEKGTELLLGAFGLLGPGELTEPMLGAEGTAALRDGAREQARRGDEGRARALYGMLSRVVSGQEKADVDAHVRNIDRWSKDISARSGPVTAAGTAARFAVRRALVEPSAAAQDDATRALTQWIRKSIELDTSFRATRAAPSREEGQEAFRGLQLGPTLLVAMHMRALDARATLAALDEARSKDLVPGEALRALDVLVERPEASRYMDLFRVFQVKARRGREDDGPSFEREALRDASFAVAAEAYRLDPTFFEAAFGVAIGLTSLGMGEAAPMVLTENFRAHSEPRELSAALGLVAQVLAQSASEGAGSEDIQCARRVYRAASALLSLADRPELAGKLQPSAARIRAIMGELEIRDGQLDGARALLEAATKTEPEGDMFLGLARVLQHQGDLKSALAAAQRGVALTDRRKRPALAGELLLLRGEIHDGLGEAKPAAESVTEALRALTASPNGRDALERVRVDRVLARVLDRFGADKDAQRALERAMVASSKDKIQAAASIGQAAGRALVRGDLALGRDALGRGLAADLPDEDLVYYALWVRLLERQLRVPTDGVAGRVFAGIADDGRWIGKLAAFGTGKLPGAALLAAARTSAQRTEAMFYDAMDKRTTGDARAAEEGLRKVLSTTALDVMEMGFARELLANPKTRAKMALPKDVRLP